VKDTSIRASLRCNLVYGLDLFEAFLDHGLALVHLKNRSRCSPARPNAELATAAEEALVIGQTDIEGFSTDPRRFLGYTLPVYFENLEDQMRTF
jgi:hypothetical protein